MEKKMTEKEERDSILKLVEETLKEKKYFVIVAGEKATGAIIGGMSPLEIAQGLSDFFEQEPRIYSSFALADSLFEVKNKMIKLYGEEGFRNMLRKGVKPKDIKNFMYG